MNRTIAVLPSLSAPVMNPLKFDGVRTVVPSTSALPAACAYGRTGRSAFRFRRDIRRVFRRRISSDKRPCARTLERAVVTVSAKRLARMRRAMVTIRWVRSGRRSQRRIDGPDASGRRSQRRIDGPDAAERFNECHDALQPSAAHAPKTSSASIHPTEWSSGRWVCCGADGSVWRASSAARVADAARGAQSQALAELSPRTMRGS